MKKLILSILLVSSFIFAGFEKANAAAVPVTIATNNAASLGTTGSLSSQANVVLYSFSVNVAGGTAVSAGAQFTFSTGTATLANAGVVTYSLYSSTTSTTFAGFTNAGTTAATLCGSVTNPAGTTFTITNANTIKKAATTYFFLVANFTQPTTAGGYTFNLNAIGAAGTISTTTTLGTALSGNAYSWGAYTPVSITLTSFNTPGVNGLAFNPITYAASNSFGPIANPAVYGFSLTGGPGITNANLLQLTLTSPTGSEFNQVNALMTLWSSPTSTLNLSTATQLSTYVPTGTATATFNLATGTTISVAPNTTTYYFVTYDYAYGGYATTQQNYTSAVGNTVTAGAQTTGFNYTVGTTGNSNPSATATNITALNPNSGATIYSPTSSLDLAGILLKTTAYTAIVSNLTFAYTISGGGAYANYFATPQLYSSTTGTFAGATAVPGAVATVTGTNISFALPNTTTAFGTGGTSYYLVINYNGAGATPATVTFTPSSYTTSCYNDQPYSVSFPVNTYTCGTPGPYVLTLSSLTSAVSTNGLSGTPVAAGAANYSVYGFSLVGSGTVVGNSSITQLIFNQNGTSADFNNAYYTTAYLYKSTTNTYIPGTTNVAGNLIATTTSTNSKSIIFNPTTAIAANNSTNMFYFIVLSNTLGDNNASTFSLAYASSTVTGTAITPSATAPAVQGPAYTFAQLPTTVTLNSFKTPGVNGLAYNPLSTGIPNPAVYGFSLTGGATGVAASITSITLNNPNPTGGASPNYYEVNGTLTLYSSPTSTLDINTPGTTATVLATSGAPSGSTTTTFTPSTPISIAAGSTTYYFVTYDKIYNFYGTYTTTEQDYLSNTGNVTITPGTQTTGNQYTISTATVPTIIAATDNTGALPATGSTFYQGATNLAVAGISLATSSTTANISNLTFAYTISGGGTFGSYFGTPTLYSSSSATFSTSTATAVTATTTTVGTSTISFDLPNTTPTFGTTPTYYFLVLNYSVTGGATPATVTFTPSRYTTSCYNDKPVAVSYTANSYTCGAPGPFVLTLTSLTSAAGTYGLAGTPITDGSTNYAVYGFSLIGSGTFAGTSSITQLVFNQNGTSADLNNAYYTTAYLYSSTSSTYGSGTTTLIATTTSTNSKSIIFNPTTAITADKSTNAYYFIVLSNTLADHNTNTFSLAYASSTVTGTAITPAVTAPAVQGPAYTFAAANPYIYYWTGLGTTSDWQNPVNWSTSTSSETTNAGTYPGANTADIANFNFFTPSWDFNGFPNAAVSIGNYNITVAQLNIGAAVQTALTVNSANSLTTPVLTIGDNSNQFVTSLTVTGTTTGTTSLLNPTGTTTMGFDSYLYVPATGIVNIASATSVTLNGNKRYPATIYVEGGTFTNTSTPINLSGVDATILTTSGTTTINNSTVTMSGNSTEFLNEGGTTNVLGSVVNVTGTVGSYLVGIQNTAGTFNIGPYVSGGVTTNSTINLGTTAANGGSSYLGNAASGSGGATMNITGATVNLVGASTSVTNQGLNSSIVSLNVNASTINLGTALASSGTNSTIYNTEKGLFYLNGNSVVNLNGSGANILNAPTTVGGSPYYGVFVCAPTSVLNPNSTTAVINNNVANTVPNAGSYFTLLSDSTASATIGKLGTGAKLLGPFNVQRYLNGGHYYLRNYRLLSSPVNVSLATSNATNLVDLDYLGASAAIPYTSTTFNGAFIAGPGTSFGGGIHAIANPLIYLYQENIVPGTAYNAQFTSGKNVGVISLNNSSYTVGTLSTAAGAGSGSASTSPSAPSTAIALPGYDNNTGGTVSVPPGNAYLLYYIDNNARTDAASAQDIPAASNVTASGYINQGQVQLYMWGSVSGQLTDTYGLAGVRLPGITEVGNPYPSTIDLKQVYMDNSTTITPSLYQLDNTTQQFNTYNASANSSSTTLSSEYIATGLGFYIHVDSLGSTKTFYFQEDQKTPSTTAAFFPPISEYSVLPPAGTTLDNVNSPLTTGKATDNLSAAAKSNTTDAVAKNNAALSADDVSQNQSAGSLNSIPSKPLPPGTKVKGAVVPYAPILTIPTVTIPASGPTEAPEVRPSAPASVIVNPAGLHLKFVVDSIINDEVGVFFNKAWSDKYDRNDSFDLDGQSGKVFLSSYTSDNVRTSVNTLGDYTGGKRVKLFVKASTAGIFKIQMTNIVNFDTTNYSVFLLDKFKADSLDLTLYKSYNFNYAPGTANDSTRFVLAIEHKPVPYYALLTFAGQKVTPGVQLNWQTTNLGNKTTFVLQKLNANNLYVGIDSLQSDSSGEFSYIDQHPTLGNNTYRLEQISVLGTITYSAPVTIGYNSTNPNGGLVLYPNPAKSTMTVTLTTSSTAVQVATADVYNTMGKLVEHKVVNSNSFVTDVSGYDLGVYIIELKNSNGVLVGKSKFVKVN